MHVVMAIAVQGNLNEVLNDSCPGTGRVSSEDLSAYP